MAVLPSAPGRIPMPAGAAFFWCPPKRMRFRITCHPTLLAWEALAIFHCCANSSNNWTFEAFRSLRGTLLVEAKESLGGT
eukprot:6297938-Pyramimonas_sp.AAC.1